MRSRGVMDVILQPYQHQQLAYLNDAMPVFTAAATEFIVTADERMWAGLSSGPHCTPIAERRHTNNVVG